jgi:branched-chain amino acid transport system permease protein
VFARRVINGRPGRALEAIRDSEVAASVMGVNVRRYKAAAFVVSSMYAGLAGCFFSLAATHVVPDSFSLMMSIGFVASIVIGGLGLVRGAVIGALIVFGLPQLLTAYSDQLPFLAEPGSGGVDAGSFARYVYGAALILVLVFLPQGIAGHKRTGRRVRRKRTSSTPSLSAHTTTHHDGPAIAVASQRAEKR